MFDILELDICGLKLLTPRRFGDSRGFFSESYNARRWSEAGLDIRFVQDNDTFSPAVGTIRGLHFQTPPFAQTKLVRVVSGAVLDVAVDIRVGSPSFGKHIALELSAKSGQQLFIPKGFAHGFCTLEPNTYVIYKVDNHYAPDHDFGLELKDPDLAIDWCTDLSKAVISDKDLNHPSFRNFQSPFVY